MRQFVTSARRNSAIIRCYFVITFFPFMMFIQESRGQVFDSGLDQRPVPLILYLETRFCISSQEIHHTVFVLGIIALKTQGCVIGIVECGDV